MFLKELLPVVPYLEDSKFFKVCCSRLYKTVMPPFFSPFSDKNLDNSLRTQIASQVLIAVLRYGE